VQTDEHLRVPGHDWLYAVGDVNGRALLTHEGKYQGRVAADHLLGRPADTLVHGGPVSPRVTFTEPQVAAVGYTLEAARAAGIDAVPVDADVNDTGGASFSAAACRARPGSWSTRTAGSSSARRSRAPTSATAALGDDRRRGRGPDRPALARGPVVPTRSEVWLKLLEAYGL
jgi:dihydrolipoamide dehydrogenase